FLSVSLRCAVFAAVTVQKCQSDTNMAAGIPEVTSLVPMNNGLTRCVHAERMTKHSCVPDAEARTIRLIRSSLHVP
ncbi:hypothetical protein COCON_G00054610, partial [Conger conger]